MPAKCGHQAANLFHAREGFTVELSMNVPGCLRDTRIYFRLLCEYASMVIENNCV